MDNRKKRGISWKKYPGKRKQQFWQFSLSEPELPDMSEFGGEAPGDMGGQFGGRE